MGIKRYTLEYNDVEDFVNLEYNPNGNIVLYKDHIKIVNELKDQIKILKHDLFWSQEEVYSLIDYLR